jgi:spore maturation protein CgeB
MLCDHDFTLLQKQCFSGPDKAVTNAIDCPVLIIGNRGGSNVGQSFERGASGLRIPTSLIESRLAMSGPRWLQRLKWHLLDRKPLGLEEFGRTVTAHCREHQPRLLLATGNAPLTAAALHEIRSLGVKCVNYLTDDPWNPAHRARWFFRALSCYDHVFTTRRSNIRDLENLRGPTVSYLPFGYDPDLFSTPALSLAEQSRFDSDVMFAGGADSDRVPYIAALSRATLKVGLYGSYWEKYRETRMLTRGQLEAHDVSKAIAGARICLCLVRRANRDGHCMRTFEVPAVGGCMLTEDTAEHRDIFGAEGESVLYFLGELEMAAKARWLLDRPEERRRLAQSAHAKIRGGDCTYQDRLRQIVQRTFLREAQ